MALAVIGGLVFSTVLSLVFVPAMFALMDDASRVSWRLGQRFIGFRGEEDTAPGHPAEPAARH
jgi:hypothetical protein